LAKLEKKTKSKQIKKLQHFEIRSTTLFFYQFRRNNVKCFPRHCPNSVLLALLQAG